MTFIEDHGYAQERYQVYCEVLQAHNLAVDPRLVTPPGNWSSTTAHQAVQILFDERHLRPKQDVEAIVAVNDKFALLVAQALQARGVRIPDDLAVAGVNNSLEGATVIRRT